MGRPNFYIFKSFFLPENPWPSQALAKRSKKKEGKRSPHSWNRHHIWKFHQLSKLFDQMTDLIWSEQTSGWNCKCNPSCSLASHAVTDPIPSLVNIIGVPDLEVSLSMKIVDSWRLTLGILCFQHYKKQWLNRDGFHLVGCIMYWPQRSKVTVAQHKVQTAPAHTGVSLGTLGSTNFALPSSCPIHHNIWYLHICSLEQFTLECNQWTC